ncbi:MAG: DUF4982 domain-containing protein [Eubacteriales bacterium]|nr:DUF4982 domain-containing protein [Eubacteriales bacterium]
MLKRTSSFNDNWFFHLGELSQAPKTGRSKTGVCGGASNGTNEEDNYYPLPERFWAIFGTQGKTAGNHCMNLAASLTDDWESICLPHDWRIRQPYTGPSSHESSAALHNLGGDCLPDGVGYYRKTFELPSEAAGQRIYLEFEGAMRHTQIWINGCYVASHFSGYSTFLTDISEYALYGDEGLNTVLVRTDTDAAEGWWGEGAGLYRDVWLTILPPLHIARDGLFLRTTALDHDQAQLTAEVELENDSDTTQEVQIQIAFSDPDGKDAGCSECRLLVPALGKAQATLPFAIDAPRLWSPDTPELYRAALSVTGERDSDALPQSFGLRNAVYTRDGLLLNGTLTELRGVCVHQDFAAVGTALSEDILRYRLQRIKDMGGNAYRSSHHSASRTLLRLCDEMGILVLNEIRHFDITTEAVSDLEDMIKSSRNHPCVYLYCLENEEFIEVLPQGRRILKRLLQLGKQWDDTRAFTTATQFGRGLPDYQLIADVAGYNYDDGDAQRLLDEHPQVRVMATEDASFVSTRGIYADSPEHGWCESYNGESYYAKLMRKNGIDPGTMGGAVSSGQLTRTYANNRLLTPQLGGMFIWTAFDYRGETFPWNWPAVISGYGAMDFCGFEKDVFYYWKSLWTKEPMVHVLPHWTWPGKEGETIRCEAYSNCEELELFLNGVSQGRKENQIGQVIDWDVVYEPGILQIAAYRNGEIVAREIHATAGNPAAIRLEAVWHGSQNCLLKASVVDADGNFCPTACLPVTFSVTGGEIAGVGNGDPACHEPDISDTRSTFNGLALCVIARPQPDLQAEASAPGLPAATYS